MARRSLKLKTWQIARALGYVRVMPDIKTRIYEAVTEADVYRVMATARHLMTEEGR